MEKELEKKFPSYFNNFTIPEGAGEKLFTGYRACKSKRADAESFIPSYEENGFPVLDATLKEDPSQYSLSLYEKPKDVKRFAIVTPGVEPPFMIAKGVTEPIYGLSQRTKERIGGRGSHIDWWLYKGATPYEVFNIIPDFGSYLEDYKSRKV